MKDPITRAKELLNGLPDQKLDTDSTGIYVPREGPVDDGLLYGMREMMPREIYVDDGEDHCRSIALVFGPDHVYYASLFAEAPELIKALLEKLEKSE